MDKDAVTVHQNNSREIKRKPKWKTNKQTITNQPTKQKPSKVLSTLVRGAPPVAGEELLICRELWVWFLQKLANWSLAMLFLWSPQQCSSLRFPRILDNDYFLFILLIRMWYLMALICMSLMMGEIECLLMCSLDICESPLKACLFRSFAQFWIGLMWWIYFFSS